jgi:MoaA/NifB/PqqE/SkfB family radical SAM enzyme
MIYSLDEIREVHLEISSFCNAECPMCPRNLFGYPVNEGYAEHNMTLEEAKQIFSTQFVGQLSRVLINGNFGDLVMNPESLDIIDYFKSNGRPDLIIDISTNGGALNQEFWTRLAKTGSCVYFCLDGLEDTHSLYRRNTLYSTVLKNARTFIAAGGTAIWKYIVFDHNQHQVEQARQLSKNFGFEDFVEIRQNRNNSPVYDHNGRLIHVIGKLNFEPPTNIATLRKQRSSADMTVSNVDIELKNKIDCEVKTSKSVYINSIGEAYPCCYIGHNPLTYFAGRYLGQANLQVKELITENNALHYGLSKAIAWFNKVQQSWQHSTVEQGRLIHCNNKCGKD